MAEGQCSSGNGTKISKKTVPPIFSDLLDLAFFSFTCQSGIRASYKIRGDPVIDRVAAFLGRLVSCSSTESKTEFDSFSPARLGNWQPELQPTEELRSLIFLRLKTAKAKGIVNE